jgi:cytidylate kinase
MLITVSGPAGSGKTTAAAALAEGLGYEHVSGGDIFRSLAADRGVSTVELNHMAEEDDSIDRDLDRRLREIAREREEVVLESRLAGWMAGDHASFRFWLDAPLSVRVARVAAREDKPVEVAREETVARAASEAERYHEYYGIDIEDRSIYDLTLNTARVGERAMVELLRSLLDAYAPDADEGKLPVEGVRYEF